MAGAAKEFLVLLLLILIFVLSCGTIMYYIECGVPKTVFKSILEVCQTTRFSIYNRMLMENRMQMEKLEI